MRRNQPYVKQLDPNNKDIILNEITLSNPFVNNNHLNRRKIRDAHRYVVLIDGTRLKVGGNNRKPCKRTGKPRVEQLLN